MINFLKLRISLGIPSFVLDFCKPLLFTGPTIPAQDHINNTLDVIINRINKMKGVHRVFFVNCINVPLETYKIFKKIDGKLYNMPFHHVQWAMRVRGNPDMFMCI